MKIHCVCGHSISDTTDMIEYKARLIPDQDFYDLMDRVFSEARSLLSAAKPYADTLDYKRALDALRNAISEPLWEYTREMWQCEQCGRLYLAGEGTRVHPFKPEEDPFPGHLLRSTAGDRWRRSMGANWFTRAHQGELWWDDGGEDEGGWEEFRDWDQLRLRYFEVFHDLLQRGVLRSAFLRKYLRKGQKLVHHWPEE